MTNPKVSIIIPVYNGQDFLRQAIDSALTQTYQNIEILVVNDGSNDAGATEHIALSYGEKIRYIAKSNGGVATALNKAIDEMKGDYFSWLSHDDLYTRDKVEKEVYALSQGGYDNLVVYSDYSVFTDHPDNDISIRLKGVPPEHFRYWITVENSLHGCTLMIPKYAFHNVGGFNEKLRTTQDYDLWFRMAKKFRFIHLAEVLVKSRRHSNQGTHQLAEIVIAECNDLQSFFIRDLSIQEIQDATGKSVVDAYQELAENMHNRRFNKAGNLAEMLVKQYDDTKFHRKFWLGKFKFYKNRLVNLAKNKVLRRFYRTSRN